LPFCYHKQITEKYSYRRPESVHICLHGSGQNEPSVNLLKSKQVQRPRSLGKQRGLSVCTTGK
jgi:hypothetical protein